MRFIIKQNKKTKEVTLIIINPPSHQPPNCNSGAITQNEACNMWDKQVGKEPAVWQGTIIIPNEWENKIVLKMTTQNMGDKLVKDPAQRTIIAKQLKEWQNHKPTA
jgi:hypothetical protein